MKKSFLLLMLLCVSSYAQQPQAIASIAKSDRGLKPADQNQKDKILIGELLDTWHLAAANAKFDAYFSAMTPDAIFIGTDASENWNIKQFKAFAKPYFDKGKAWNFKAVERNIFVSADIAWFDELLDTPNMKICRGSGVLRKEKGEWKIAHYVLSMTIPNDNADEVTKMKTEFDDKYVQQLLEKK